MHWLKKKWQQHRDEILVERKLKEQNERVKKISEFIGESIPKLDYGACFHGEIWYRCPHCHKGIEAHSIGDTEDNIHICFYCGGKYYYSRFER